MSDADQHAFFMALALEQARIGLDEGELPIGAVLVNDGQAITVAHTCEKAEQRRLVHAELLALDLADRLRPFPGRRSTTVLYTTLEPCMMCMGACINFGVSEVHYALASPTDGLLPCQNPMATSSLGQKPSPAFSGSKALLCSKSIARSNRTGPCASGQKPCWQIDRQWREPRRNAVSD